MKKAFFVAALAASCFTLSAKMAAAHPSKRTPQVTSAVVQDQVGMTANGPYNKVTTWLSGNLGEVGPGQYVWSINRPRGFYKKVEVTFHLISASDTFDFKIKQQKRGSVKYNGQVRVGSDGKPQDWPLWVQDGPYPYPNSTRVINAQKQLFLYDAPGVGTGGPEGAGIAESYIYDMHFRDKVKWNGPKGEQDILREPKPDGTQDPDPYFGYWKRYIAIWTNPAAPPNGTNDRWTEGGGGG